MPSPLADHLAARFASDARALRARASALAAAGPAAASGRGGASRKPAPRPAGLTVESTERMASACDQVQAMFAETGSDEAARALLPVLAGLVAGARTEDERYVYAGAVARLTDALDGDDADDPADDVDDTDLDDTDADDDDLDDDSDDEAEDARA